MSRQEPLRRLLGDLAIVLLRGRHKDFQAPPIAYLIPTLNPNVPYYWCLTSTLKAYRTYARNPFDVCTTA